MVAVVARRTSRQVLIGAAAIALISSGMLLGKQPAAKPDPGPQNWSNGERFRWYTESQGSRLIPEAWLVALEAPDTSTLFMDPVYFSRFNYLSSSVVAATAARMKQSCDKTSGNDALLPLGFARDCQSDKNLNVTSLRWFTGQKDKEYWIGLNCAACHTAQISVGGQPLIVDGAPTLADFQGFTDNLTKAMLQTQTDPAKWNRFAVRVIKPQQAREKDGSRVLSDTAMLKRAFGMLLSHQQELALYNQTDIVYGHGRLDAVGHILNKVAWLNHDDQPLRGEPNAPVSYPFIWNANQHDFVQWNGLVPNQNVKIGLGEVKAGALVRNTSEVIGVFADLTTRPDAGLNGYQSSVAIDNLVRMENLLGRLKSPKWPAEFGIPDPGQVDHGRRLFAESCKGCHASLSRDDLSSPIVAEMTPVWGAASLGTDPWMACNTFAYQARGGLLTGTKDITTKDPVTGKPLLVPETGPTRGYLKTQAIGVLLRNKFKILWIAAKAAIGIETNFDKGGVPEVEAPPLPPRDQKSAAELLAECKTAAGSLADTNTDRENRRILAYKGRPLNGIWATAPYLHNGSVRTLYDLLLEPVKRPSKFWVGNRQFDPDHVGFVGTPGPVGSWFNAKNSDNSDVFGNSTLGHNYGNARFSEADRLALVAYMKTL